MANGIRSGIVCFLMLVLIGEKNVQGQAVCPPLRPPWNGQILRPCQRFVGSECRFVCRSSYSIRGSAFRVCQADGTWSGQMTSCERGNGGTGRDVRCPGLTAPSGGYLEGVCNPGTVGSSCVFRCTGNLVIQGQPALVCLPSGRWSDEPPICRGRTGQQNGGSCPVLTPPPGGRLVGVCSTANTGDTCQLVCISGYRPSETRVLVCQGNGEWSDELPTCIGGQCPSIVVREGGSTVGSCSPGVQGESCTVRCNPGYSLVGTATVTCLENGEWSGATPTCRRSASCPSLLPPVHGSSSGNCSPGQANQVCYFSCDNGYRLVGSSTLVCGSNGVWSGDAPTCEASSCPSLRPPARGSYSGTCSPGQVGQSCIFTCNSGSRLVGESVLMCQENGRWSGSPPSCEGVTCPTLVAGPNSVVSGSCTQPSPGQSCVYTCLPGYILVGQSTLICQPSGIWSSGAPVCEAATCPPLNPPPNGFVSGSCDRASVSQRCTFACQSGYTLVGTPTLICQSGSYWSSSPPSCTREATCPNLYAPEHGYIIGTCAPGQVGQNCVFGCEEGYSLDGSRSLTCQSSGTWSGRPPVCNRENGGLEDGQCPPQTPPPNGEFTECDNRPGGRCVVVCRRGYVRTGSRVRTCLAQGTWSGYAPTCSRRVVYGYKVVPLWSLVFG